MVRCLSPRLHPVFHLVPCASKGYTPSPRPQGSGPANGVGRSCQQGQPNRSSANACLLCAFSAFVWPSLYFSANRPKPPIPLPCRTSKTPNSPAFASPIPIAAGPLAIAASSGTPAMAVALGSYKTQHFPVVGKRCSFSTTTMAGSSVPSRSPIRNSLPRCC